MSVDEHNRRYEEAMSTLAELAAKHQLRAPRLEESFVLLDKLIHKARLERRKKNGEQPDGSSGECC
jgi:hypothetical protein